MTPTQLNIFITVAKFGSFNKAATVLDQSRPGISAAIKALEHEFRGALFTRSVGDIKLTLLGREVLAHAVVIATEYDQLRQIAKVGSGNADGMLRIAATPSLCCWPLPRLLQALRIPQPRLLVKVVEAQTADLPPLLAQGLADVALSTSPIPGWNWSLLLQEAFVALFSRDTMAGSDDLSTVQLSNIPVVITEGSIELLIEAAFEQAGAILRKSYVASSYAAAFAMVQEGLGVSILPISIARLAPATLLPIPIKDGPSRVVGLVHSMEPSTPVRDFLTNAEHILKPPTGQTAPNRILMSV